MKKQVYVSMIAVLLGVLAVTTLRLGAAEPRDNRSGERFFEMRTYTTHEGKLNALHKRFRDHTNALFAKHGIEIVGYWTPADEARSKDTLIYILAYPSREAQAKSWKAFQDDKDWKKAKDASEKDGPIVKHVESVFMHPTDYSPIR